MHCHGVKYPTGTVQCYRDPTWVVNGETYSCDRHLVRALDRGHENVVVPIIQGEIAQRCPGHSDPVT
jgi:hypothetical protein